jgi:hypothetical protein
MRRVCLITLAAVLLLSTALTAGEAEISEEKAAIEKVIETAYVKGIQTDWDGEAAMKGFHPDFVMLILEDGAIRKFPIADWVKSLEQNRAKNPEGPTYKITYEIPMVDITGDAAVAKIELYKDGTHIFTDYMSLYKFADGWKIVGKIFQRHK